MPGFKWHECPRCMFWFDCDLAPTYSKNHPTQISSSQPAVSLTSPFDPREVINNLSHPQETFTGGIDSDNVFQTGSSLIDKEPLSPVKSEQTCTWGNITSDISIHSDDKKQSSDKIAPQEDDLDLIQDKIKIDTAGKENNLVSHDYALNNEQYQCVICGKHCASKKLLRRHVLVHGLDDRSQQSEESDGHPGAKDYAGLLANTSAKTIFSRNKCTKCNKSFNTRRGLHDHDRNIHAEPSEKYKCTKCDKLFKNNNLLYNHVRYVHSEVRAFSCAICSKSFPLKQGVAVHIRTVHRTSLDCAVCGKNCSDRESLAKHTNTHKHQNIFKCLKCDKKFGALRNLEAHSHRHRNVDEFIICAKDDDRNNDDRNNYDGDLSNKDFADISETKIKLENTDNIEMHTTTFESNLSEVDTNHTNDCTESSSDYSFDVLKVKTENNAENCEGNMSPKQYTEASILKGFNTAFRCPKCSRSFPTKNQMLKHRQTHKKFHCVPCGRDFTRKVYFISHNKTYHPPARTHHCSWCSKSFVTRHQMQHHLRYVHDHRYECPTCRTKFAHVDEYEKHFETQRFCKKPKYDCCMCEQSFSVKEWLFKHYKGHRNDPEYKCRICGFQRASFKLVYRHILNIRHHAQSENMCSECGVLFSSAANLRRHMRAHSDIRPWACSICQKTFKSEANRNTHVERVHTFKDAVRNFKCSLCPAMCKYAVDLKRHMKTKHGGEFPFECHSCQFKSHHKSTYEKHVQATHPDKHPYQCVHCLAGYVLESDLRDHLIYTHSQTDLSQDWHRCIACQMKFCFKEQLEIHIRRSHTKEFKCTLCRSRYKTRQSLDKHYENKHPDGTNKVSFPCEKCLKEFAIKSERDSHMLRVHSDLRPFSCTEPGCFKTFKVAASLKSHVKVMHIGVEKPNRCIECGKCFQTSSKLKNHFRIHSGEKPFHCVECNYSCALKENLRKHMRVHNK